MSNTYRRESQAAGTRRSGTRVAPFPGLPSPFVATTAWSTSSPHPSTVCFSGDGSVDSDTVVELPIYDEDHSFTGDYVSHGDRAWEVVQRFVASTEPGLLGEWAET